MTVIRTLRLSFKLKYAKCKKNGSYRLRVGDSKNVSKDTAINKSSGRTRNTENPLGPISGQDTAE